MILQSTLAKACPVMIMYRGLQTSLQTACKSSKPPNISRLQNHSLQSCFRVLGFPYFTEKLGTRNPPSPITYHSSLTSHISSLPLSSLPLSVPSSLSLSLSPSPTLSVSSPITHHSCTTLSTLTSLPLTTFTKYTPASKPDKSICSKSFDFCSTLIPAVLYISSLFIFCPVFIILI